jgi:hypothetical protein
VLSWPRRVAKCVAGPVTLSGDEDGVATESEAGDSGGTVAAWNVRW